MMTAEYSSTKFCEVLGLPVLKFCRIVNYACDVHVTLF